jgi:hypothetical protein
MHGFFYKFLKISTIILATYGLFLGVIIPWAAPQFLPQFISQKIGIHTNFTQAKLNPFTFQLSLKNLEIFDQKGSTVLGIEEFKVDFNPSSLLKKEVLIKSTKAINPRLYVIIDSNGQFNLANIITDSNATQQKSNSPSSFHFSLKHGAIENGSIRFTDASKKEVFTTKLENLNYTIQDISTKPQTLGAHEFGANGALFEDIAWEGGISLEPFKLYGQIWLNGLPLVPWWEYLAPKEITYSLKSADAWLGLPYRLFFENGSLHVSLDEAWIELKNLQITKEGKPFISLDDFSVDSHLLEVAFLKDIDINLQGLSLGGKGLHVSLPKEFPFDLKLQEALLSELDAKVNGADYNATFKELYLDGFKGFMALSQNPFAGFKSLQIDQTHLKPNSIKSTNLNINNPFLTTILNDAFIPDFLANISPSKEENASNLDWRFELASMNITSGEANISTPTQNHNLKALHVKAQNLQYPPTKKLQYSLNSIFDNANLNSNGSLDLESFAWSGNFELKHPNLQHYNAYLKPYFLGNISKGSLHVKGDGNLAGKDWNIKSTFQVQDFSLLAPNKTQIAGIEDLKITKIDASPSKLQLMGINLNEPYLNVHIYKTMETNLDALFPPTLVKNEQNDSKKSSYELVLEGVSLEQGVMDFADDSLPLPFKVRIQDLGGEFSSFETHNSKPAKVRLEGHVEPHGYAKVEGEMYPLDPAEKLNINLLFNNIDVTRLSPYSGKFVGYAFKNGRLDLDLGYHIENSQLVGENSIILHDLALGEIVDSPDAVQLPLQLAIALLKDSHGKIDIDLPVRGDLNDPQFAYGSLIFKAIGNLIAGIVTSPFRFLGNMLGIDGEELKSINFELGFATLLPPAIEKIANYTKILSERPGINLKITPTYNQEADSYALKAAILQEQFNGSTGVPYGELLAILYTQAFAQERLEELKLSHTKDKTLNTRAFEEAMYEALVHVQPLDESALEILATKRANAIYDALINEGVLEEHLEIDSISIGVLIQNRWIESPMEITL